MLAGGASKRMGRDKALLPYRGRTLVEYVAANVRDAVGNVALIGHPARLSHLGLPVHPDEIAACGPACGIVTALRLSNTAWNLIVACDMPAASSDVLRRLLAHAQEASEENVISATGPDGQPEPLCAVYHRRCLPPLETAVRDKRLKMRNLLRELGTVSIPVGVSALANVNTPTEWAEFEAAALKGLRQE